jgi:hypothetical protein
MRHTTSLRLLALFLGVASSAGTATMVGAQSTADRAPAAVSNGTEARSARVAGTMGSTAAGNSAATASRSVLLDRRAVGLTRLTQEDAKREAPMPRQEGGSSRTNTALMVVGAAAVVLGAAVGDEAGTVLIIGGAGIGLFGLYRMLN